jgi:hypothetical protein
LLEFNNWLRKYLLNLFLHKLMMFQLT